MPSSGRKPPTGGRVNRFGANGIEVNQVAQPHQRSSPEMQSEDKQVSLNVGPSPALQALRLRDPSGSSSFWFGRGAFQQHPEMAAHSIEDLAACPDRLAGGVHKFVDLCKVKMPG